MPNPDPIRLEPRALLRRLFAMAVDSALPENCLPPHLPRRPSGRLVVMGAGKAAAAMARVAEGHFGADLEGLVVTPYGHAVPCQRVEVLEAAHPVPDAAGVAAARRLLALAEGAGAGDTVLCLLSGGGSALLCLPPEGLGLADLQSVNRGLLACGASIAEINCVRRHLSAITGGRLAAACRPARVVNLLISDVPGDTPLDIASGPTVPDPTRCGEALDILGRYRIAAPAAVLDLLASGRGETVKPGDPRLAGVSSRMAATAMTALRAAEQEVLSQGLQARVLSDRIEGEARRVGAGMAALALQEQGAGKPPTVLLSGGETTVRVRGTGRGGRNSEFLLALAIALDGRPGIHALACDTDGVDGTDPIAGAIVTPDTLARARALGLDPSAMLERNDAHSFFEALGDSVVTGPTRTNVNDFRAILVTRDGLEMPEK